MKKTIQIFPLLFVLLLGACKKDEPVIGPELFLLSGTGGYVQSDTMLSSGSFINFQIKAVKGSANITNLTVSFNYGTENVVLDTGMNSGGFTIQKTFIKGLADEEKWTITAMDRNRNRATTSVLINRDTAGGFGQVLLQSNITLGAQQNTLTGGFLNPWAGIPWLPCDAFNRQDSADIVAYYGPDLWTLASPGANIEAGIFTGPCSPDTWLLRQETRYHPVTIAPQSLESFQNDSILLAVFKEGDAKRKAKNLVKDDVFAFRTANNKIGLFRVNATTGTTAGSIDISILIQE